MKRNRVVLLVLTALALGVLSSGCGGGGGDNGDSVNETVTVEGRWVGTVSLDADQSCVPLDNPVELSQTAYTLDVDTLNNTTQQTVVDQDATLFSGFSEAGIIDGSFYVSDSSSDGLSPPQGATAFEFLPNDGNSAQVKAYVFYNRFCTTVFSGDFTKTGPVPNTSVRPQDVTGRWRGELSLVQDSCLLGVNPLSEVHQVTADTLNVTVESNGRRLQGQRDSLNSFYSQVSVDDDGGAISTIDSIDYRDISNGVAQVMVSHFVSGATGCSTSWEGEMRRE